MKTLRHWWIQKPIRTNCPLEYRGAVFEEFEPTVREQNCEWIKVFSSDDFHTKAGMGITRYSQVCAEKSELESRLAWAEALLKRAKGLIDLPHATHGADQFLADLKAGLGGERDE